MNNAPSRVLPREPRSGAGFGMGSFFLKGIAESFQVGADGGFEHVGLGEVGVQLGDEARHLFLEGFAVVFDFLGPDVAAGREDVAVRGDCGGGGRWAEAGDVGILTRSCGVAERFRSRSFLFLRASAAPREPALR